MFQVSFERGEGDALIGGPPSPEQDSNDNVISVFIGKVIDPDNPFGTSVSLGFSFVETSREEWVINGVKKQLFFLWFQDAVRILLLQFSALLVEHACQHIHDPANK